MTPIVSICMITYNHEKYIADAIKGVLRQNTRFDFELVIGEDCSTDNTLKICRQFATANKSKIHLITSDDNVGFMRNAERVLDSCRGKYIAYCEGDDYWTDPFKLQKQVDFLETHPDFGLVHTGGDIYKAKEGKLIENVHNLSEAVFKESIFIEMLKWNYRILSCSVLFRKDLLDRLLNFEELTKLQFRMLDTPVFLEFAYHSKIGYFNERMVVRRHLSQSASQHESKLSRALWAQNNNQMRLYYLMKYAPENFALRKEIELSLNRSILRSAYLSGRNDQAITNALKGVLKSHAGLKLKVLYLIMYYGAVFSGILGIVKHRNVAK